MPLYTYVKAPILPPPTKRPPKKPGKFKRLIPPVLITLGSILIANVTWPLISYQLFTSPDIQHQNFVAPIPIDQLGNQPTPDTPSQSDPTTPLVMGSNLDYTNARNWFPTAQFAPRLQAANEYTLDIPSLDVEAAEVFIGGEDLSQGLIHYPGTANPGQFGSPVIFGHSVLRQFYNPRVDNTNRYISIFSKIMTLKTGDRIFVNYDGIRYTYEVKDKVEVQPEDLFILEQKYHNRELKLITCVPEGTYLRRGVVIAQLIDITGETDTNVIDN